jgi:hypothetical protein
VTLVAQVAKVAMVAMVVVLVALLAQSCSLMESLNHSLHQCDVVFVVVVLGEWVVVDFHQHVGRATRRMLLLVFQRKTPPSACAFPHCGADSPLVGIV